jgi:hypothetical protein
VSGPPEARAAPASSPFATARIVVLALALVLWLLPWSQSFRGFTDDARVESGASRTGAVAALAFVLAWGLGTTARQARTRRGLDLGEAATSCAVAGLVALLVAIEHPWVPGAGQRSAAWLPIFVPLALLSALDLVVRLRRPGAGAEVTAIRAGSGLVAALALAVARQPLPATAALLVALGAGATLLPSTEAGSRRAHDALALAAALALLFAMPLRSAVDAPARVIKDVSAAPVAFQACAAALVVLTGAHALRRRSAGTAT